MIHTITYSAHDLYEMHEDGEPVFWSAAHAERVAAQHGMTLAELDIEPTPTGRYDAWLVLEAIGY